MARSPAALADFWNRQAPTYDRRMSALERRFFADSRAWVGGRAHGTTLEIAIGTGANLPHYAADLDLTGVDWSPAMLDATRRRAAQLNRVVTLQQADAAALPFPAESFDTVVSTFAMCCVPDERVALAEALRVLRPGGTLLLADHIRSSFWPLRIAQHAVDLITVPTEGEHYTRRPSATLLELGLAADEGDRLSLGTIERIQARKGSAGPHSIG